MTFVRERPTDRDPPPAPFSWGELTASYTIDMEKDRDFFWVWVGRTMYYMCTSMQVFLYFYFRDVMQAQEESLTRWRLGLLVLIAMLVGLCTALPAGYISEWIGRKPVVYFSTCSMAVAYMIFAFAPFFGPEVGLQIVYCGAGLFYGMGSGAFQSVDYALALDVLPKGDGGSRVKGSSEALGTWG